jgi:type IV pilus assembly protein PilM
MGKSDAVWGIDIGQSALKALKCRLHNDGKRLIAEAFDFIEYPKILSQPDADPVELVGDAIAQFLSRNDVKNDRVAISVSGQSGLARFIKLPPVESKKIPDIVKFEARQQIPFALEDVVWDFQQMAGGSEEEGYALETEVGLFAMKRDQVFRALRPFTDAGIEVDVVQLTPIALYNYIVFDQMQGLPPADQFDAENPPESMVVMSMGTDTTDLVITNGYRVWQRSIPLGGSHFTKAITKELKVTFTKAEQLKRTALKSEEAKSIFQAMRPVFNDLVTEVQRSISFFGSLNKTARLGRIVALGNTMKLRGLQKFLAQNLGMEVVEPEKYRGLTGNAVVDSPAFEDNHLAYAVCYGLCVQGVGKGTLGTNLLPDEIFADRLIKEKKPWAVAAVALLLVGCVAGFAGYWRGWSSVQIKGTKYEAAFDSISRLSTQSSEAVASYKSATDALTAVATTGENLSGIADRRLLWIELMKALDECLPRDPGEPPKDIGKRNQLHITRMDCAYYTDLTTWFADVGPKWKEQNPVGGAAPAAATQPAAEPAAGDEAASGDPAAPAADQATTPAEATAPPADAAAPPDPAANPPADANTPAEPAATPDANAATDPNAAADPNAAVDPNAAADPNSAADPNATGATGEATGGGPTGAGFVIELEGYHFHNEGFRSRGEAFIRDTLIENLKSLTVTLPVHKDGGTVMVPFTMKELGVDYPVVTFASALVTRTIGDSTQGGYGGNAIPMPTTTADGGAASGIPQPITVRECQFRVQFCWKPTPTGKRLEAKAKADKQPPAKQPQVVAAAATKEQEATQ